MKNFTIVATVVLLIAAMWHGIFENNPVTLGIGTGGLFILWIYDSFKGKK
ncbi:MAG: hypothetical protein ACKOPP_02790 [Bacteroidota bacterium]